MSKKKANCGQTHVDDRALRTRNALAMALMQLGRSKPVDDISVAELAGRAGIARSTFYAHFADMGDFLAASYAAMLASLVARASADDAQAPLAVGYILDHVYAAKDFAGAIQNSRERPRMLQVGEARLRAIAEANLMRLAPDLPVHERRNTAVFLAGGFMGLLRAWMEDGCRQAPERIRAAFEGLSRRVIAR